MERLLAKPVLSLSCYFILHAATLSVAYVVVL
jgi:hypothetical protein